MRVAVLCSGLDSVLRGYESHTRHLFENLKRDQPRWDLYLFKRDGTPRKDEIVLRVPDRDSPLVGRLTQVRSLTRIPQILDARSRYYWEHVFFSARFVAWTARRKLAFDRILTIEPMVAAHVHKARRLLPGSPLTIYTHGLSLSPRHYVHIADRVHEVSIENFERARAEAGSERRLRLIPHFLPDEAPPPMTRPEARRRLGVRTEKVLLSVGVLQRQPKRMDYVIEEASRLGPEWSLLLAGPPEEPELITLGKRRLGDRFVHHLLPRERIAEAYQAADLFVLGSLEEGFGLVILEAMRAGVPPIVHDRPLFRWVVKSTGACVDLAEPGALAAFVESFGSQPAWREAQSRKSREAFLMHYTWDALRREYEELIADAP